MGLERAAQKRIFFVVEKEGNFLGETYENLKNFFGGVARKNFFFTCTPSLLTRFLLTWQGKSETVGG